MIEFGKYLKITLKDDIVFLQNLVCSSLFTLSLKLAFNTMVLVASYPPQARIVTSPDLQKIGFVFVRN